MNGTLNVEMVLTNVAVKLKKNVVKNGNNVVENIGMVEIVAQKVLNVKNKMNGIHNV